MNGGRVSFKIHQKKTTLQALADFIRKTAFRRFKIREGDVIVLDDVWDADILIKEMAAKGYELETEDRKEFKVTKSGNMLKMG